MADGANAYKKEIIGYAIFFIVSFIITFSLLYILMRGFKSPFKKSEPLTDSTAVKIDSTQLVSTDSLKQKEKDQDPMDEVTADKLLEKEKEIELLKEQVAD